MPTSNFIIRFFSVLTLSCFFAVPGLMAQQETYDIVTYTPPAKYTKEVKKNVVVYTFTDPKDTTWCQIAIYKNTASLGSIEKDFDKEWAELVAKQMDIKDAAMKEEVREGDGWKVMSGSVEWMFNNKPTATILTTLSGYNVCVSIMVNTNAVRYLEDFQKMMGSIDLAKPDLVETKGMSGSTDAGSSSIEGVWVKSGGVSPEYGNPASWGISGYTKDQYIFHGDGSYAFYAKSFGYAMNKLILVRERGTYRLKGNQLTLTPSKSVTESWSKKDNADNWGKLLSSEPRELESATYTVTKHYFSGIQQWNLILQPTQKTRRDGEFGSNPLFEKAYFYAPVSPNNVVIVLPD